MGALQAAAETLASALGGGGRRRLFQGDNPRLPLCYIAAHDTTVSLISRWHHSPVDESHKQQRMEPVEDLHGASVQEVALQLTCMAS